MGIPSARFAAQTRVCCHIGVTSFAAFVFEAARQLGVAEPPERLIHGQIKGHRMLPNSVSHNTNWSTMLVLHCCRKQITLDILTRHCVILAGV